MRWTQTSGVILSCKVLTVQQGQQTSTFLALVKGCLSQAELGGGVFPLKMSQSFTEVPEQASGWRGLREHTGTCHITGRGARGGRIKNISGRYRYPPEEPQK